MNSRAFTLVELLAGVAILGVLAAIALPLTSSMKQNYQQSQCISNARQLSLAYVRYQSENNGRICSMGQVMESTGELSNWMTRIRPYFEADTYADIRLKFMCPSHPKFVKDNAAHVGWAFNTQLAPVDLQQISILKVEKPALTIYATDGYRDFDWSSGDGQRVGYTVPTAQKKNYTAGERVFFPHHGKTVATFLDGHTELLGAPISRDLWAIQK